MPFAFYKLTVQVPFAVSKLVNLEELYANDNRITEIKALLPPNLRFLSLDGNSIRSLSSLLENATFPSLTKYEPVFET